MTSQRSSVNSNPCAELHRHVLIRFLISHSISERTMYVFAGYRCAFDPALSRSCRRSILPVGFLGN